MKVTHFCRAAALAAALTLSHPVSAQNPLITGKAIALPPPGTQQDVGSMPMNMVLSPDGRYAVSSDMGFRQSLWTIDTRTGRGVFHLDFPAGRSDAPANGLYYGLAISDNENGSGTLYAAMGADARIAVVKLAADGKLSRIGTLNAQTGDLVAGLALDKRGYLYAAINETRNAATFGPTPENPTPAMAPSSLAIFSTTTGRQVGRFTFQEPGSIQPNFPYAVAVLADGSKAYVASQRDGTVYVLNTTHPAAPVLAAALPTGSHPDALLLNRAQTRLFVANAHSDTISVIDTAANRVRSTILLRPDQARGLAGATPTGLALSPNEQTLYVALGDMNAVGVVDVPGARLKGYFSAGWYPAALVVPAGTGTLLVANAKGVRTRNPNPYTLDNHDARERNYILNIIEGTVGARPIPQDLAAATREVLANNRLLPQGANSRNPLADLGRRSGKITHVIYIVKENRTYDQVLGDLPQGNGDASLTLFGQSVTPNLHALATRFVLLDNFYDCGEVSGDGWPWSTGSFANEYVIKNLPYNYSGRGHTYDFEGQVDDYPAAGFPAANPDGRPLSDRFPAGAPPIPDVGEAPGGHFWDSVERAKLTYRNYGFFYTFGIEKVIPDNYPASAGLQPPGHNLAGRSDYDYRRFDLDYADSDGFALAGEPLKMAVYGKFRMPCRFAEWNREFQQMLARDPSGRGVPAVMTLRFPNDHTLGTRPGAPAPRAFAADNDFAVGEFVQAVSHSPIWPHTAIFVIEDDAQDGSDHVDAHRSTCYVISPYIKHNTVDHTFYNTDSVLRTMEDLLDLPPLSQYDALATPIGGWDRAPRTLMPYTAILPDKGLFALVNPPLSKLQTGSALYRLAAQSEVMDLTHPDSAPAGLLNEMLWQSVHGESSTMPPSRHTLRVPAPSKRPVFRRAH